MNPLRVIIVGAKGRMGRALIECVNADPDLALAGEIDLGDDLEAVIDQADAVVDFSLHKATLDVAKLAAARGKTLVIGSTGHDDAERAAVRGAVKSIPCVWASNFSTGVNTLFYLCAKAAKLVGPDWNIEVVETHHTAKKDAPSGTARTLQETIEQVTGQPVPAHSQRIGDVVGDHTVTFGTVGERLELTHRAGSRATFARGALRAAKWAAHQPPGLYDMRDVLGLR